MAGGGSIPLEAARGKLKEMKNVLPVIGTEWRIYFFRMDLPQGHAQAGTAWSPPMVGDFHALDRFGTLVFGDEKGQAPGAVPAAVKDSATKDTPAVKNTPTKDAPATKAKPDEKAPVVPVEPVKVNKAIMRHYVGPTQ